MRKWMIITSAVGIAGAMATMGDPVNVSADEAGNLERRGKAREATAEEAAEAEALAAEQAAEAEAAEADELAAMDAATGDEGDEAENEESAA